MKPLAVSSTGGPVTEDGDLDQRVREWCEVLGLAPAVADNAEEVPE